MIWPCHTILPGPRDASMKAKWPSHRSSVSPPRRPGASTSATPAPRSSTGCYAKRRNGTFILRFDDTDLERSKRRIRRRDRDRSRVARNRQPDLVRRQSERMAALRRSSRKAQSPGPRSTPPTRRRTSSTGAASGSRRSAGRRSMIAPRLRLIEAERAALEASGPRAALALPARAGDRALGRHRARAEPHRLRVAVRSGLAARGRDLSLHAALRGRRHRPRRHTRHPRRGSRHQHRSADPDFRGARRRRAPPLRSPQPADRRGRRRAFEAHRALCRSPRLRESGVEALAVAALAVLVGSAEAVRPIDSLDELAAPGRSVDISHGAARFDEAELAALVGAHSASPRLTRRCAERLAALGDRRTGGRAAVAGGARQPRAPRRRARYGGKSSRARSPRSSRTPIFSMSVAAHARPRAVGPVDLGRMDERGSRTLTGRKGRALFHPLRLALDRARSPGRNSPRCCR